MEKIQFPVIILCVLSIVVSCILHKIIRNYTLACFVSGIISLVFFHIIGIFVVGHLDPFFLIASLKIAIITFAIALVVGIPFVCKRYNSK